MYDDDLTIKENISFFGYLWIKQNSDKRENSTIIQKLQLEAVANKLVGSLP
jgi:ABC-2 type transport system ATP-binding protein